MGSLRVRHDRATSLTLFTFMHWRRKWQPTPVFLPGESQGRGILVGCRLWGRTESDTTKVTQQQQQRMWFTVWVVQYWCHMRKNCRQWGLVEISWGWIGNWVERRMQWDLADLELGNQIEPWGSLLKGSMNFSFSKLYSVIRNIVYLSLIKRKLFIKTSTQHGFLSVVWFLQSSN